MSFRVGLGKDSHRFVEEKSDKPLIIGGIEFPGHPSFVAHSDGDVLYHAVFNAISSGLGLHSIGHYFPNGSADEAGRNSREYLLYVKNICLDAGYKIANLSITVECKFPAIDPVSNKIRAKIAEVLSLDWSQIGITATSGEQTSPWGQGLGVEVTAIVLLEKN